MKLNQNDEIVYKSNTSFDTVKAVISAENIDKLFSMLESPYKDSISSIVRETVSNSFDAHAEANFIKNNSIADIRKEFSTYNSHTDEEIQVLKDAMQNFDSDPVVVGMFTDHNGTYWSTEDFGVGLSEYRVKKIFVSYLSSTKDSSNNAIGAFGIGAKSPLSYTDVFYIRTRYLGTEYTYALRKGVSGPELDLLSTTPTLERNGTLIKIYLKKSDDSSKFISACQNQLRYFDNVVFDGTIYISNTHSLYLGKNYIMDSRNGTSYFQNTLHICNGQVAYPIDFSILGIDPIKVDLALKFEIGELDVIQTREDLRYTPKTVEAVLAKIEALKEELHELLEEQTPAITDDFYTYLLSLGKSRDSLKLHAEKTIVVGWLHKDSSEREIQYKKFVDIGIKKNPTGISSLIEPFVKTTSYISESRAVTSYLPNFVSILKSNPTAIIYRATGDLESKKNKYVRSLVSSGEQVYIIRKREVDKAELLKKYPFDDYDPQFLDIVEKEVLSLAVKHSKSYEKVVVPKDFNKKNTRALIDRSVLNFTVPTIINGSVRVDKYQFGSLPKKNFWCIYTLPERSEELILLWGIISKGLIKYRYLKQIPKFYTTSATNHRKLEEVGNFIQLDTFLKNNDQLKTIIVLVKNYLQFGKYFIDYDEYRAVLRYIKTTPEEKEWFAKIDHFFNLVSNYYWVLPKTTVPEFLATLETLLQNVKYDEGIEKDFLKFIDKFKYLRFLNIMYPNFGKDKTHPFIKAQMLNKIIPKNKKFHLLTTNLQKSEYSFNVDEMLDNVINTLDNDN